MPRVDTETSSINPQQRTEVGVVEDTMNKPLTIFDIGRGDYLQGLRIDDPVQIPSLAGLPVDEQSFLDFRRELDEHTDSLPPTQLSLRSRFESTH